MANLIDLQRRAAELKRRTAANSISPDDVFSFQEDVLELIKELQEGGGTGGGRATDVEYEDGERSEEGSGTIADAVTALQELCASLSAEIFPLVVAYDSNNAGTFEYGTSITPSAAWTAKRQGNNVAPSSVVIGSSATWGTLAADKLSYSANAAVNLTSQLKFSATVSQGGQQKSLAEISWNPSFYRYRGEVSEIPTDFARSIKLLSTKELSTTTTLGTTALGANKYYLFAVKSDTPVTLRAYLDSPEAPVSGSVTGSVQIEQENEYKEAGSTTVKKNTYYYILVPKSSNSWNFKIKNS